MNTQNCGIRSNPGGRKAETARIRRSLKPRNPTDDVRIQTGWGSEGGIVSGGSPVRRLQQVSARSDTHQMSLGFAVDVAGATDRVPGRTWFHGCSSVRIVAVDGGNEKPSWTLRGETRRVSSCSTGRNERYRRSPETNRRRTALQPVHRDRQDARHPRSCATGRSQMSHVLPRGRRTPLTTWRTSDRFAAPNSTNIRGS